MNHPQTQNVILTSREFYRSPAKVADILQTGQSITVTNRGQDFFDVTPRQSQKGMTIKDFEYLQFSDKNIDKDLSMRVDEIVYGSA